MADRNQATMLSLASLLSLHPYLAYSLDTLAVFRVRSLPAGLGQLFAKEKGLVWGEEINKLNGNDLKTHYL